MFHRHESLIKCDMTLAFCGSSSYKLNIWDVGGQKSIRSYWRNYFEQTDGIVWVVDSADRLRLTDCERKLKKFLKKEVIFVFTIYYCFKLMTVTKSDNVI